MATILDTLTQAGSFTILVSGLSKTGLSDTLQEPEFLTLFAPTDDAFNALPAGMLNSLLQDTAMLHSVLLHHLVAGRITSDEIKEQQINSALAQDGESVMIDVSLFGRIKVDTATVTRADVPADNGIIHVIDEVLLPTTMRGQRAA